MSPASDRQPIIYVVDDEESNRFVMMATLKSEKYVVHTFRSGPEFFDFLDKGEDAPDLLLLDVMMPGMDGLEVCRLVRSRPNFWRLPIVLVTGLDGVEDKVAGLERGADDYIIKPFHPMEVRARVRSLLRIKSFGDQLENNNLLLSDAKLHLEMLVQERTQELEDITIGVVAALEKANEFNDTDTGRHILRVCSYCEMLARGLDLPGDIVAKIRRYASLHDVGKVGVPDNLLKKPGPLTKEEYEEMKKHTVMGYELLYLARSDKMAQNIALCHHEKYNGKGYPFGLKGEEIPIEARIVALADVFDALTTKRCYKNAYSLELARSIIEEEKGSHFDPALVDILLSRWDQVEAIMGQYRDDPTSGFTLANELPPRPVSPLLEFLKKSRPESN